MDDPEVPVIPRQDKRRAPRRLNEGMYILPSLFTTANIGLGCYAILQVFHGSLADPIHFDYAARAIGFAVLFDGLDGRIARMTGTTSDFGRELDSLADVITFGVAPALLAWAWGFRQLDLSSLGILGRIGQFGAIASFFFLMAGASRLARFNITTNPQPSNPGRPGKKYFVGMPTPAAASMVAATVYASNSEPLHWWFWSVAWLGLAAPAIPVAKAKGAVRSLVVPSHQAQRSPRRSPAPRKHPHKRLPLEPAPQAPHSSLEPWRTCKPVAS